MLTANYEYSRTNTDTLQLPEQMQLSEKLKSLSRIFYSIFSTCFKFRTLRKKNEPFSLSIAEVIVPQRRVNLNA